MDGFVRRFVAKNSRSDLHHVRSRVHLTSEHDVNGLSFDFSLSQNLQEGLAREWATTNPFGCSACMSILSIPTRRRHGLLIPACGESSEPPACLKNVDEQLLISDCAYPLSSHLYAKTIHPEGYLNLDEVIFSPFLTWVYRVEDILLSKTFIMASGYPAVFLRYQILDGDPDSVRLELRPMLTQNNRDGAEILSAKEKNGGKVTIQSKSGQPSMCFYHNAAIVDREPVFYRKIFYPADQKEGLDVVEEDLWSPFRLGYIFMRSQIVYLAASVGESLSFDPVLALRNEEARARAA